MALTNPSGFFGGINPTPYFLNKNVGFLFSYNNIFSSSETHVPLTSTVEPSRLNRTTDGGIHWKYLGYFDSIDCRIEQIYFVSIDHGYLAGSTGVFETVDTGSSWKRISPDTHGYCSVYSAGTSVYAYRFPFPKGGFGELLSTTNDGKSWNTIIPLGFPYLGIQIAMSPYVFGNKDSLVYAETFNTDNGDMLLVYSTDNGKNWSKNILNTFTYYDDLPITTGLFCLPHCNTIFRTFNPGILQDIGYDTYSLDESTDYGATWNMRLPLHEMGAWITGNACALYVSDGDYTSYSLYGSRDSALGPLRSTDVGKSWQHIDPEIINAGPSFIELDDQDFHNLSVVGGGSILYVGDVSSAFWRTTDGGDGTLSSSAFASQLTISNDLVPGNPDTLFSGLCDSAIMNVVFRNVSCNYAQFFGLHFDGLDSTEYTTVLKHHQFCDGLSDTLVIRIVPHETFPTRNLQLRLTFINDEYETIDTGFSFILKTTSASGKESVSFRSARIINDSLNITIHLPIYFHHSGAMNDVDMVMHYPTRSLKYLNGVSYNGKSIDGAGSRWAGRAALHFAAADLNAAPDSLIGYANFQWTPYEFDCDYIGFDSIETSEAPCSGLPLPFQGIIGSYKSCGASFIEQHGGNSAFDFSLYPNPASNTVGIVVNNTTSSCEYQLFDALGIVLKKGMMRGELFEINISGLPSGKYYLRLSNIQGIPATKPLVILR